MNESANQPLNSGILRQQEFLDNDVKANQQFIHQQNIIDEKITNNMLKINVVLYLFTLAMIGIFVFVTNTAFYMEVRQPDSKDGQGVKINENQTLYFSLFLFTYKYPNLTKVSNFYQCVKNSTNCDNSCQGVDIKYLNRTFPIECSDYGKFSIAGVIVSKTIYYK
jgi:hypothetical protein